MSPQKDDTVEDDMESKATEETGLEPVEGLSSKRQSRAILFVKTPNSRIQVPAVIVELIVDGFDLIEGYLLNMLEADDDICDLHAGVVDVVLDFDCFAGRAQHPDRRIAEHGIAQMTNVRSFIRIDGGVLDDDLAP